MKIVVNKCYGGFGLSKAAVEYMASKGHSEAIEELSRDSFYGNICNGDTERADPLLVEAVEELGPIASGNCAKLQITEIPDGIEWQIGEYDGQEWVEEKHRSW